jgi:microcystin-dependent protein
VAISIPLTSTTNLYTDAGAAIFDFGGTPYAAGYLFVQNAGAYISLKTANAQGSATWGPEFATNTALVPLAGGTASLARPNGPDRIYGVRARSLVAGTPAVVYGGVFQEGEAAVLPSNQVGGTISTSGQITNPSQVNTGTITAFAGSSAPTGWLICNGAALDSTTDSSVAALFSVIGTTYGGTGASNFYLPDLRGRVVVAVGPNADVASLGANEGSAAANRRPKHPHSFSLTVQPYGDYRQNPGGSGPEVAGGNLGSADYGYNNIGNAVSATGTIGASGTANDAPAYIVLQYIISK